MPRLSILVLALLYPNVADAQACEPDGQWQGVGASRWDDTVAAWTGEAVHVSRDGGATFRRHAIAEGVGDVAVDRAGRVYLMDGDGALTLVRADGSVARRPFPHVYAGSLVADGRRVAALVEEPMVGVVIAESTDGGRRFRLGRRDVGYASNLFLEADHALHAVEASVNTCGSSDLLEWVRRDSASEIGGTHTRSTFRVADVGWATQFHGGAHGWVYGHDPQRGRLLALTPQKTMVVSGVRTVRDTWLPMISGSNGRISVMLVDGQLVRLEGSRGAVLSRAVPDDVSRIAVDLRGRVLVVAGPHDGDAIVRRFARRTGWSELLPACGG